jgi:hypothetical protein
MTATNFSNQIRELIARDELEAALTQLRRLLEHSPKLDEVILQTARFSDIRRQIRLGLVNHQEANLTQNQIRAGLLDLLQEVEAQGAAPALKDEIEKAVSIVNNLQVQGNQNIIFQGVSDSTITVTVNGETASGASPRQAYNKILTRALVEAMRSYNDKAEKLCQDYSWLEHPENRRKVQQFVFQNFVGEIGKQLRKLVNIGDDEQMDAAQRARHYVDKCLDIARRSFELLNYTLLSVWWDAAKTAPRTLEPVEQQNLDAFFESHLEQGLDAQFRLLQTLCGLFRRYEPAFPFGNALERLLPELTAGSTLQRACAELEQAVQKRDAATAERRLADLMQHFAFLTQYRMASLKKISYRQLRNGQPEYLHRYVALGIDIKYSEDAEKGRWVTLGEQTPAVLLYQGEDYQNGINLFPFVVDYNALTFEQGAKICFYSARDLGDAGALEYRFLGDSSILRIEKQGVQTPQAKLDELMMNPDLLKALNLDCVVDGFHEARLAISGNQNDFFDNL